MDKINEYAKAKNQWIAARIKMAIKSCDLEVLKEKVERLKDNFLQQKKLVDAECQDCYELRILL